LRQVHARGRQFSRLATVQPIQKDTTSAPTTKTWKRKVLEMENIRLYMNKMDSFVADVMVKYRTVAAKLSFV